MVTTYCCSAYATLGTTFFAFNLGGFFTGSTLVAFDVPGRTAGLPAGATEAAGFLVTGLAADLLTPVTEADPFDVCFAGVCFNWALTPAGTFPDVDVVLFVLSNFLGFCLGNFGGFDTDDLPIAVDSELSELIAVAELEEDTVGKLKTDPDLLFSSF